MLLRRLEFRNKHYGEVIDKHVGEDIDEQQKRTILMIMWEKILIEHIE